MTRLRSILFPLAAAIALGCRSEPPAAAADLVLRNGRIITVDAALGTAQALAIRGDRIQAVGSDRDIARLIDTETRVVDLAGRTAIPGFIEGHGHFTGIGDSLQILDLRKVESWDEVIDLVRKAVANAKPGEWILGRGWHQEKWSTRPQPNVEGFPTHDALSAVSPNNPVCLTHASGHACFFNKSAMDLAKITATTPDPAGGEILKDAKGEPCGIFRETAQGLVRRFYMAQQMRLPAADRRAALRRSIRLADAECSRKGVTSFQDAGSSFHTIDVLRDMVDRGELHTRLWVMIRDSNARLAVNLARYRTVGYGQNHLTVRAIKRTIDGALGSRGAWLLEPYSDSPNSTGLATASIESVTETARLARAAGYQLCVHAIGDRANREVLDIFEQATHGLTDHRWRIEHAQHLDPEDIPRFAKLGVIASMQGVHCTSDAPYVIPRLGEKRAREGAYVWRSLIDSGALVTNGTDAPVEDVDPIAGYYATVSRRLTDGSRFFPEQRMTRMEALRSYTIWAARAAFEDDRKGSLSPGKLADVVVLSKDITTCPEEEIPEARVVTTIIGGKVVYEARTR